MAPRGVLLIEVLLAIAIFGALGAIATQALVVSYQASESSAGKGAATQLTAETVRAVRAASDESWQDLYDLTKDTQHYYPLLVNGSWTIAVGDELITLGTNTYTRYFTVSNVSRNPTTRDIEESYVSANDDPSTQKITVVVSATSTGTLSTNAYIMRWRNLVCDQDAWSSSGASGVKTCPDASYTSATNITPGNALELCSGGC